MGARLQSLCRFIRRCLRPDPGVRLGDAEPEMPVLLPGHWHGIYRLALSGRGSIWYFERHFERRSMPGCGDRLDPW
ncbi:MAG TPA: hypothetical protein VMW18_19385 [Candidatus Binatia bacterium]|nr:hypothetical protein [Candidatus Binatia bacterium]